MEEAKKKAQATYNSAADSFDHPANSYWKRYGTKTIERLKLLTGNSVLDVACGTGASAIPAAQLVGAAGKVIGIDLAEKMLDAGKSKAQQLGLENIEFKYQDMTAIHSHFNDEFDAVVCVFGVFFVPDMENLVRGLWRCVKPGGRLAITTWGPNLFEPMYTVFNNAVRALRPELVSDFRPWDRLTEKQSLQRLLSVTDSNEIFCEAENGELSLTSLDDWWKIVMGSGLRSVVESLGPQNAEEVRKNCLSYLEKNRIKKIETNVIYGTAIKTIVG